MFAESKSIPEKAQDERFSDRTRYLSTEKEVDNCEEKLQP